MEATGGGLKIFGAMVAVLGVVLATISLFIPTSVETTGVYGLPERVTNLARIHQQGSFFNWGAMLFVGGCILHVGGALLEALTAPRVATSSAAAAPPASPAISKASLPPVAQEPAPLPAEPINGESSRSVMIAAILITAFLIIGIVVLGSKQ